MSYDGVGLRAVMRSVAFLTAGALAVPALAGCGSDDEASRPLAGQDIAPAARSQVADGGTMRWAVDALPQTLNTFQADADAGTTRVAQAVLPSMFRLDASGRPVRNPDYLESAKVVQTEPRQVVVYKLNQQAVWSDGREIGADDFAAQWRALSGKDSAYWTARNAGYDRIEKIEKGANDLEVRVTFSRPYADWQSLFSPLYPKQVMGSPDSFNDGARRKLEVTAGPFQIQNIDTSAKNIVLARNPRWWGHPAKLSELVLQTVPRDQRASALADGAVDLADIEPDEAQRIGLTSHGKGGAGAPLQGAGRTAAKKLRKPFETYQDEQAGLSGFEVRKSLEPAYTQLALNGSGGPLADERVRRAVARALDRTQLAKLVLTPLGLPAVPVGSHIALSGQTDYTDGSNALGGQDTNEAQSLLADAGWVAGGPVKEPQKPEKAAGPQVETPAKDDKKDEKREAPSEGGDDGAYVVGGDGKAPHDAAPKDQDEGNSHLAQESKKYADKHPGQGGAPGAYAPQGTAAPAGASSRMLAKDGKSLTLRFVLPSGPGSESLSAVADRISRMLEKVGIRTEISRVADQSYFKDHIAAGQYDLALYSWPSSPFPATDDRPVYAKPVPAADGSLNIEQNYTRIGTDQVDQLFDQAVATLDQDESRDLLRKADARIWAAAGSIPLYQRPQLTAARKTLVNAGAFGFQTPIYEDMGFLKKGAKPAASPSPK